MKKCNSCGTTCGDNAKFCGSCGKMLSEIPKQPVATKTDSPEKTQLVKRIEIANILVLVLWAISILFNLSFGSFYYGYIVLGKWISIAMLAALAWNAFLRFKRWREWKKAD